MPEDEAVCEERRQDVPQEAESKQSAASGAAARHYRAFVSYRHADVDSKVAAAVQSGLERFYVPKSARGSWGSAHIAPVFRDKEELPVSSALGDDIDAALRGADAFILICSPRTQESSWVAREIDLYLKYHGRSHVFVVLAEGEPADVIPERLLFETRQVVQSDGSVREELVEKEPLACDFRASAKRERRTELTRLAAAILGVSFDSLNRRAQRRRARIIASVAAVVTTVALGVAGYALWSNARIQENYRQSLQQQSQYLTTAARESLDDGDRLAAIELASAALPEAGEDRPFHPAALQVLAEALRAYDEGESARPWAASGLAAKYQMAGTVWRIATSKDERYLAVADSLGNLRVWDIEADKPVFETTYSARDRSGVSLAITNDGLLAVAGDGTISCFDLHGTDPLWRLNVVQDVEGADEEEYINAADCGMQLVDQGHLVALGNTCAHLLDVRTGEVKKSVPYEKDAPDAVNFFPERLAGAWDPTSKSLVVPCLRSISEVDENGYTYSVKSSEYQTYLMSFKDGSSVLLDAVRYVTGALFSGVGTLIVSGRESGDSEGISSYVVMSALQITQYPYGLKTACIDLKTRKVRWSRESQAYQPFGYDAFFDLDDGVEGYEGGRLVAHCFANVCELLDYENGEVLRRWETSDSVNLAWPSADSDLVSGRILDGVLEDGSSFALRIYEGRSQSFSNPSFYRDMRFADGCCAKLEKDVLLYGDNTVYRYADTLEGDRAQEVCGYTDTYKDLYSTACGVLMKEIIENSEGYGVGSRFSLVDALGGGTVWSSEYVADDAFYGPSVLGDPTNTDHLFLYFVSKDASASDRVVVLDLASGEESSYEVADTIEGTPPDGMHLLNFLHAAVTAHYAASAIDKTTTMEVTTEEGEPSSRTEHAAQLAITDLMTGKSETIPLSAFGDVAARFSEPTFDAEGCSVSPTGRHVVVPLENVRDESFALKQSAEYGVLDVDAHKLVLLPARLKTSMYDGGGSSEVRTVVWADDGERFVAATEDGMTVFDTQGAQVSNVPGGGRVVLSVCVLGERLLMICAEEDEVSVVAYGLETGERLGRCPVRGVDGSYLSPNSISWIRSDTSERDPGELCLLAGGTLYVMSLDPFGVCQVVDSCEGYDDVARAFVVGKNVPIGGPGEYGEAFYAYPRHSIDDLLAWGRETVGASGMTDAERLGYGLDASE